MAHPGVEEIQDYTDCVQGPHCTPAVDSPFEWADETHDENAQS